MTFACALWSLFYEFEHHLSYNRLNLSICTSIHQDDSSFHPKRCRKLWVCSHPTLRKCRAYSDIEIVRLLELSETKRCRLPWICSPLKYIDNHSRFHLRDESSPMELFFDLFFVANLATFTANHSIVDERSLYAYIGFFIIIWATWFQVTLHDVRFALDSFYERVCKTVQLIIFVTFALVGANFFSNDVAGDNHVVRFPLQSFLLCGRSHLTFLYRTSGFSPLFSASVEPS
jgi:hypothetical protein